MVIKATLLSNQEALLPTVDLLRLAIIIKTRVAMVDLLNSIRLIRTSNTKVALRLAEVHHLLATAHCLAIKDEARLRISRPILTKDHLLGNT